MRVMMRSAARPSRRSCSRDRTSTTSDRTWATWVGAVSTIVRYGRPLFGKYSGRHARRRLERTAGTTETHRRQRGSAANPVAKVQDSVTLDDHVGVLQKMLVGDFAEVSLARSEYDRDDVHCHLIDQP